jgi:hypothetical protein
MGAIRHGDSNTRLHIIWLSMRRRCRGTAGEETNKYYKGKNIKVCAEWNEYEKFKKWAIESGYSDDLTIDRINVNGDYEPKNCKWSNIKEQANNRTNNHLITYNGITLDIAQWAEKLGMKRQTLQKRITGYKWSIDKAFNQKVRKGGKYNDQ